MGGGGGGGEGFFLCWGVLCVERRLWPSTGAHFQRQLNGSPVRMSVITTRHNCRLSQSGIALLVDLLNEFRLSMSGAADGAGTRSTPIRSLRRIPLVQY